MGRQRKGVIPALSVHFVKTIGVLFYTIHILHMNYQWYIWPGMFILLRSRIPDFRIKLAKNK